jgi:hypothetical protein
VFSGRNENGFPTVRPIKMEIYKEKYLYLDKS